MKGLRYFKRMTGITNRMIAKDMGVSLLMANIWTSGYENIPNNHKEEMEEVYGIPFYLMKEDMTSESIQKMDIAILKSLQKISCEDDIKFNKTIYFDGFTALGYVLFIQNMSKKELSGRMGLSVQTVQSFFKENKVIPLKHLIPLSKILDLPEHLLKGKLYIEMKWNIDLNYHNQEKNFKEAI
jgi:hypothetical protein